jgi:hypothetical protein
MGQRDKHARSRCGQAFSRSLIQASKLESSSQAKGDLKRSNIKVAICQLLSHERNPQNALSRRTLRLSSLVN